MHRMINDLLCNHSRIRFAQFDTFIWINLDELFVALISFPLGWWWEILMIGCWEIYFQNSDGLFIFGIVLVLLTPKVSRSYQCN